MATDTFDHAVPPGLTFPAAGIGVPSRTPRLSRSGLAFVLALHALVFWLLLQANVIALPEQLSVLTVSLVRPAEESKPRPEVVPPRPQPVKPRPAPPQPPVQLAAPEASPAPAPVVVPAAPAPTPPVVVPAAPAQATQPRFDADYLDNPKPPYPSLSRRIGEEGRVVLRVRVMPDGAAGEVLLHASSGSPRLDESALATVRRWKFVPARRGAEPVAAWVLVPIAFKLKE
ncbi:MAG: TonB family protein [Denitratisoma sp.]|nr:TonB family protein [Denitratisoma sp.]